MDEFRSWDEAELHRLCEQHALENAFLEFKSSATIDRQDTEQIAKVVCAFVNAGGGQVLFGVQEGSDGRAEALDEGWIPNQRKNGWLGDVILDHVTPKVDFEIVTVPLASSRELYVVNVHQGYTAHQASDGKFYRRHEAKCIPMDWFEIEDVRNRKARPVLEVQIEMIPNDVDVMPHVSASSTLPVTVYFAVTNKSPALIEYLQLHVWFHERVHWDPESLIEPWRLQGPEPLPSEWKLYESFGQFSRMLLQRTPADSFFLMQSEHPVTLNPLLIVFNPFTPMLPMPWKLEVPGMKALTGTVLFWMERSGRLKCETVRGDADHTEILQRVKRLICEGMRQH